MTILEFCFDVLLHFLHIKCNERNVLSPPSATISNYSFFLTI